MEFEIGDILYDGEGPELNIFNKQTNLHIYATNYNIFRISYGLASVVYFS